MLRDLWKGLRKLGSPSSGGKPLLRASFHGSRSRPARPLFFQKRKKKALRLDRRPGHSARKTPWRHFANAFHPPGGGTADEKQKANSKCANNALTRCPLAGWLTKNVHAPAAPKGGKQITERNGRSARCEQTKRPKEAHAIHLHMPHSNLSRRATMR